MSASLTASTGRPSFCCTTVDPSQAFVCVPARQPSSFALFPQSASSLVTRAAHLGRTRSDLTTASQRTGSMIFHPGWSFGSAPLFGKKCLSLATKARQKCSQAAK